MSRVSGEKIKIKLFLCNKKMVWLRVCQILIRTTNYYGCLFGSGESVGNVALHTTSRMPVLRYGANGN
jgi:hypothetical protein